MLRIESRNGRIFAVNLVDMVAITFAEGVVTFHTGRGGTISLGGEAWGGPVSREEANDIIDLWGDELDLVELEEADLEPLPSPPMPPPDTGLDVTTPVASPVPPPAKRKKKRSGRSWKEIKRQAKN